MDIKINRDGKKTIVILRGNAIVDNMEMLKNKLLDIMTNAFIVLDISGLSDFDFSFFQLIISLRRSVTAENRLEIVNNSGNGFLNQWEGYGFDINSVGSFYNKGENNWIEII